MNSILKVILNFAILIVITLLSCNKYKDPAPIDDNQIAERKYCNDLRAYNYNWGFPGKPDSTICIYASEYYVGNYFVTDSILDSVGNYSGGSVIGNVSLVQTDKYSKIDLVNYCSTPINLKVNRYLIVSADTSDDRPFIICGSDTFTLYGKKNNIDSMDFKLSKISWNRSLKDHDLFFKKL